MKKLLAPLAALSFVLVLTAPAGANHEANHTCGIFPRVPELGIAGAGFSTPELADKGVTDNAVVDADCLSLATHEPFTAFLDVTFQYLDQGVWVDSATISCQAESRGVMGREVVAVTSPGNCDATYEYAHGESQGTQHRASFEVTTNVTDGPHVIGHTAAWPVPGTRTKAGA